MVEPIEVWVVWGPEDIHGGQPEPLEVFTDQDEAESWMAGRAETQLQDKLKHLRRDGTVSFILHRGVEDEAGATCSIVMSNPGERMVSDYFVKKGVFVEQNTGVEV